MYLTLQETAEIFVKVIILFYIPTSSVWDPFNYSHLSGYKEVSRFILIFLMLNICSCSY